MGGLRYINGLFLGSWDGDVHGEEKGSYGQKNHGTFFNMIVAFHSQQLPHRASEDAVAIAG